jgi:hypothetical protein
MITTKGGNIARPNSPKEATMKTQHFDKGFIVSHFDHEDGNHAFFCHDQETGIGGTIRWDNTMYVSIRIIWGKRVYYFVVKTPVKAHYKNAEYLFTEFANFVYLARKTKKAIMSVIKRFNSLKITTFITSNLNMGKVEKVYVREF